MEEYDNNDVNKEGFEVFFGKRNWSYVLKNGYYFGSRKREGIVFEVEV